ncbi:MULTISPECIES: ALQxL family class IV lanthipeptide [Sphaerisporangium]|uniref:Uncharacterized protein n=2 Tax=Sphaerisporangium TaxID=321315 RepID=A0A7W8Z4L6_9ACTN|nr:MULTISPECIES: ALQxL family class IV lanthipeptide [Sphaerisporangium]MBB4700847.1 hypothetical protein [Sphaerisporangium siamense]MBB5627374.1 hypothetical protein [Sphaerisporangium krabiense]
MTVDVDALQTLRAEDFQGLARCDYTCWFTCFWTED